MSIAIEITIYFHAFIFRASHLCTDWLLSIIRSLPLINSPLCCKLLMHCLVHIVIDLAVQFLLLNPYLLFFNDSSETSYELTLVKQCALVLLYLSLKYTLIFN